MDDQITCNEIAKMIDHAILKPDTTINELLIELDEANRLNVFSVCVRPAHALEAKRYLTKIKSRVLVGTVVGFPHGSQTHSTKMHEIEDMASAGVDEIDIVIDIGLLKDATSDKKYIPILTKQLREQVAKALNSGVEVTKLILETEYLSSEEIKLGSKLGSEAGFDFLKTSTGFADSGATIFNILIMKKASQEGTRLKASGGVSNLETLLKLKEFGVTRFGTSKTSKILESVEKYNRGELKNTDENMVNSEY